MGYGASHHDPRSPWCLWEDRAGVPSWYGDHRSADRTAIALAIAVHRARHRFALSSRRPGTTQRVFGTRPAVSLSPPSKAIAMMLLAQRSPLAGDTWPPPPGTTRRDYGSFRLDPVMIGLSTRDRTFPVNLRMTSAGFTWGNEWRNLPARCANVFAKRCENEAKAIYPPSISAAGFVGAKGLPPRVSQSCFVVFMVRPGVT